MAKMAEMDAGIGFTEFGGNWISRQSSSSMGRKCASSTVDELEVEGKLTLTT